MSDSTLYILLLLIFLLLLLFLLFMIASTCCGRALLAPFLTGRQRQRRDSQRIASPHDWVELQGIPQPPIHHRVLSFPHPHGAEVEWGKKIGGILTHASPQKLWNGAA
ncbi:hypothetical protein DFJ77DRAFT_441971 [Powellomyces hirtus]|nr:hypothetical protein DFJ77DRAFT_441971 [Powellomyces hirtus]